MSPLIAPQPCRSPAFTLVELLVVVGIIVVLLAILLPNLDRAMDSSTTAKCLSNFNTLGKATEMYKLQNRRTYPAHHLNGDMYGMAVWPGRLRQYAGGAAKVFNCPEMEDERALWDERYYGETYDSAWGGYNTSVGAVGIGVGYSMPRETSTTGNPPSKVDGTRYGYHPNEVPIFGPDTFFSYGYNDWGTAGAGGTQGLGGNAANPADYVKASGVFSPASMIMLGDTTINGSWDTCIDPTNGQEAPKFRHRNLTEVGIAWADGHASTEGRWVIEINPADSPSYGNNRSRWNRDHKPH
jgi:type II secretory pathway pseudopilin PulG